MTESFISAREVAAGVKAGEWSARQLVDEHLSAIEAGDGAIGAFLHVDAEGARAAADAVDAAVAAGRDAGPLAGVPVALKDNMCTRGLPTTCASKILEGWVPPYDGTVVERLRAAGAVIVGKTNLDDLEIGRASCRERVASVV